MWNGQLKKSILMPEETMTAMSACLLDMEERSFKQNRERTFSKINLRATFICNIKTGYDCQHTWQFYWNYVSNIYRIFFSCKENNCGTFLRKKFGACSIYFQSTMVFVESSWGRRRIGKAAKVWTFFFQVARSRCDLCTSRKRPVP